MNRVIFLLCLILVVGCARSNNSVSTVALKEDARILWQNYAGNVQGNYVVNDLPDVSVQVNESIEGNVYSAPVIFKDQNGVQSVVVLTRIGTVLALVKYTIEGNALVKDGAFITSPLQSDENYNHHQIALVEEEDQVYVYVAHKNGIAKYNAYEGGSSVASYDSGTDSVFRLLVDGDIVYAQSASVLLKLNTDLTELASVEADFSFDSEDRSLPLVISGETVYVVSDQIFTVLILILLTLLIVMK